MIKEEEGFIDHVIEFFMQNQDIYYRYAKHYWNKVQVRLHRDDMDAESLIQLKSRIQEDLKLNEKNEGNKYPRHFILTNSNFMSETIRLIDRLLIKKSKEDGTGKEIL